MSLTGKNRAIFSYQNRDCQNKNFSLKDFEKTKSYHTNFFNSNFSYTSFRAAHLKFCNFDSAIFDSSEFIGTNLRGSSFKNAKFENAIFLYTVLDKTDFTNATFTNCYFVGVNINKCKSFPNNVPGITCLPNIPPVSLFSNNLIQAVENLRSNDIIRNSHTLHRKKGKINTLSLLILLKEYNEYELIEMLNKIPYMLTSQFYTLSYLQKLLSKVKICDIV